MARKQVICIYATETPLKEWQKYIVQKEYENSYDILINGKIKNFTKDCFMQPLPPPVLEPALQKQIDDILKDL